MIPVIRFADNIVIIAKNEGGTQTQETLTTFKMSINEQKTKIPICARKHQNIVTDMYNIQIIINLTKQANFRIYVV